MIALRSFHRSWTTKRCALRLTISTTPARLRLRITWSSTSSSMKAPSRCSDLRRWSSRRASRESAAP
eukprot:5866934-Prymnesium_polylepis.1